MRNRQLAVFVAVMLVAGGIVMTGQTPPPDPYRSVAEQYVKLVLAVGQHDADYVDAFYGPRRVAQGSRGVKDAARGDRCAGRRDGSAAGRDRAAKPKPTTPKCGGCAGNT